MDSAARERCLSAEKKEFTKEEKNSCSIEAMRNFSEAKAHAVQEDIFPIASLRHIIASKKASGRMKDRLDLHLLELFRLEYESRKERAFGSDTVSEK